MSARPGGGSFPRRTTRKGLVRTFLKFSSQTAEVSDVMATHDSIDTACSCCQDAPAGIFSLLARLGMLQLSHGR